MGKIRGRSELESFLVNDYFQEHEDAYVDDILNYIRKHELSSESFPIQKMTAVGIILKTRKFERWRPKGSRNMKYRLKTEYKN